MKLNSYTITQGKDRAPARAFLKAIGLTDEDMKKPIIGIANTWIGTMPCNFKLRELAVDVAEGIRQAGGTPMEYNTIAISDGITMGTEGMKASLVSRDLIADSIELVARGHMFDGIVALVACDKTIPGAAMALLRLNTPSLILYGGSILPGHHNGPRSYDSGCIRSRRREFGRQDVGRGIAGDREFRLPGRGRVRRTIHREHDGDGDGADRAVAARHGRSSASGRSQARCCGALRTAGAGPGEEQLRPRDIVTRKAIDNAIASVATTGGSTNAVLHLLAIAREAGIPLGIDDFQTISERTPLLVDLKPAGKFVAVDVDKAGGIPVIAQRLVQGGYADGSAMTVTGRTLGEEAAEAKETPGQEVIHPLDNPIKKSGGLVILRGSLAPDGCVIKVTGIERSEQRGPGARVRNRGSSHGGGYRWKDSPWRYRRDPL